MADDFTIDPRTKYGAEIEWETGDDFTSFVDALNRGVTVRGADVPGEDGAPEDISANALALSELRAKFSSYQ